MTSIDVYKGWIDLLKNYICNDSFTEELQKEAGRRYLGCVVKYSMSLRREDLKVFLEYAATYCSLLNYANPLGRERIIKRYFQVFGIKLGGIGIRLIKRVVVAVRRLCWSATPVT